MATKNYLLQLKSPDEIKNVDVKWDFQQSNQTVNVSTEIDNEKIELSHQSTESALRELTNLLKGKYEINSCFTCRFGNFCPIGDQDNEIFCLNDFEPKCKEDIYFFTEDDAERQKRSHTLFYVCDKFKPCSKDYYTYK